MTDMIVVEKTGVLRQTFMKKYAEDELYKKCGFKKGSDFSKHADWNVTVDKKKYRVSLHGKLTGKANTENKYDFPPPADNLLLFGACVLVCHDVSSQAVCGMTLDLWEKMYEKLFGGFEDLAATAQEDENEIDELANVPSDKKTKTGYLKDGFIVDDDAEEEVSADGSESTDACVNSDSETDSDILQELGELHLEDIGTESELEEEEYDYEDEDEDEAE